MQYTDDQQWVTLHGLAVGGVQVATKRQNAKYVNAAKGTCTLLLTTIKPQTPLESSIDWNSLPAELQSLLCQYVVLFDTPQGLPPPR